jgi:hypothetical protein
MVHCGCTFTMSNERFRSSPEPLHASVSRHEQLQNVPEASRPFEDAVSFDQLYVALNRMDNIVGTDGTVYETNDLRDVVTNVRNGIQHLHALTRAEGLRDTVSRLLCEEYTEVIAHAESLEALKPIITRMSGITGVWHPISAGEHIKILEHIEDGTITLNDHNAHFFTRTNGLRDRVIQLSKAHHGHT